MGLISAIKSVLGLGGSDDRSRDGSTGTNVTVVRETDATSERAVKESDPTEVTVTNESETTSDDEPDQTGDEEPIEDGESETGDGMADTADTETAGETKDAPDTDEGASVEEIRGIGSAYAERLADAGVHTVSELAAADAAELSSETGVSESRIANWIERASEH